MATFEQVLEQLRENQPQGKYGIAFEKLMVNYFRCDPVLSAEYTDVCRWNDWRYSNGSPDTGIDLVARRTEDKQWVAIQCKFYQSTTSIQKGHLDSFFEASGRTFKTENGRESFAQRFIISTTDRWSKNAEAMLENQVIPTNRIGLADIAESPIDWEVMFPGAGIEVNLTRKQVFSPRPHQEKAIEKVMAGFAAHERGKLVMACGTGKTFTALRLAERYATQNGNRARVLFLVPSISLLSQTLKEWIAQAELDLRAYAVCSDSKVSKKAEDIASYDLSVPVSTKGAHVVECLSKRKRAAGLSVVFCTYQSLPVIHDAQQQGLDDFDLIICDEAHRTTGVTLAGEDPSHFVRIHDATYIRGAKRLYMTATPRLYDDDVKGKASDHFAEIASMDDEAVYGPEFHCLGFGEAVEKGLLTDYKVLVMAVEETAGAEALAQNAKANEAGEVNLSLAAAMIGAWNALAKRSGKEQGKKAGFDYDEPPMQRAVAFARDINTSKRISENFARLIRNHQQGLYQHEDDSEVSLHHADVAVASKHVDGSMNAMVRSNRLSWLSASMPDGEIRVLTNARCLSEGVDVPSLDAVIFFSPRNSQVDVVQSVGRVMRKSPDKDYGYVVLPVAVAPGQSPSEALNDSKRFKVVWQILNALRAHDERFNAVVNSIALNQGSPMELPIEFDYVSPPSKSSDNNRHEAGDSSTAGDRDAAKRAAVTSGGVGTSEREPQPVPERDFAETIALFSLEQWQEAMYVKIVDKVGTRTYWEDWADDVATIAEAQTTRIHALLDAATPKIKREFRRFVKGLRGNLNDSITEDEAISMLSQHLITAPVFNALFAEYDFAEHNPVSQVMQRMVDALSDAQLESETEELEKFYESVRVRAAEVTSASGKQQVVKELYERFFRKAFKKQSEALGIVYTPVEIVDFILRSADALSKKHFGRGLSDEGVHVLDPFTGTGTFLVRLLQSGLVKPEDLARKYASELHATEIMLLAYYVAAVNIETTYNALEAERALREGHEVPEYVPYAGIALADTFQIHEAEDTIDFDVFRENNEAIERQKRAPIHVVVGNPPYSVGQTNANDLNANLKYPTLDKRIEQTYVAKSSATNKNSLYDSYLRAFRWATDRIGDHGIVAFVSNGGWLDGNTADGVRLSMAEEFSDIYVFNLRGNQRTAGELSRKEGGKVFGSGSRATVAITLGVKTPGSEACTIHYCDIGDYLSTAEKLEIVDDANIATIDWQTITPNIHGDWLSQRSEEFGTWPVLGDKKLKHAVTIFERFSAGLKTGRDAWCYNSSAAKVISNMTRLVEKYDEVRVQFRGWLSRQGENRVSVQQVDRFLQSAPSLTSPANTSWTYAMKTHLLRDRTLNVPAKAIVPSLYRPFTPQYAYFHAPLVDRVGQLPSMFPTPVHDNIGFYVVNPGSAKPFSVLATSMIPDLAMWGSNAGQFFPRWTWEPVQGAEGELDLGMYAVSADQRGVEGEVRDGYRRVDNITDQILAEYRAALGDLSKDDIFYFVYGQLHDPVYRETYAADLKKMLPHIETPKDRARFDALADAGRRLMELHVGYEYVEPWDLDVAVKNGVDPLDRETWRVIKPRWAKTTDPETGKRIDDVTTILYNKNVTIKGIPAEAEDYMLGSRSALGWVLDRYQVKTDKASGIVNDPNDWADEVGNPRYIVDLIAKVTRVAVETSRIVAELGK